LNPRRRLRGGLVADLIEAVAEAKRLVVTACIVGRFDRVAGEIADFVEVHSRFRWLTVAGLGAAPAGRIESGEQLPNLPAAAAEAAGDALLAEARAAPAAGPLAVGFERPGDNRQDNQQGHKNPEQKAGNGGHGSCCDGMKAPGPHRASPGLVFCVAGRWAITTIRD